MLECYDQWRHRPYLQANADAVSDEVEVEAETEFDEMIAENNEMLLLIFDEQMRKNG